MGVHTKEGLDISQKMTNSDNEPIEACILPKLGQNKAFEADPKVLYFRGAQTRPPYVLEPNPVRTKAPPLYSTYDMVQPSRDRIRYF